MDPSTYRRILQDIEAAEGTADLKRILVELAAAVYAVSRQPDRTERVRQAALSFENRSKRG